MAATSHSREPRPVKAMIAYRRMPGRSVSEFQRALLEPAPATPRLRSVRRYVRSITTSTAYRRRDPIYDAVDELWFDDEPSARATLASEPLASLHGDLGADPDSVASFLVHDHLIKDGPIAPGGLKNFEFVTRRPDLSVAEFRRYWREHHGPLASGIETMRHYVQSHAVDSEYEAGRRPAWEGSAITWFDDLEAMRASAACDVYAATRADEANFLGAPLQLPFIITTEHVLIAEEPATWSS